MEASLSSCKFTCSKLHTGLQSAILRLTTPTHLLTSIWPSYLGNADPPILATKSALNIGIGGHTIAMCFLGYLHLEQEKWSGFDQGLFTPRPDTAMLCHPFGVSIPPPVPSPKGITGSDFIKSHDASSYDVGDQQWITGILYTKPF